MATSSTDDLITRLGRQRAISDDASILATFPTISGDASASERRALLLHALDAATRAHQWDVALRSVDELLTTNHTADETPRFRWVRARLLDRLGRSDEAEQERHLYADAEPRDLHLRALAISDRASTLSEEEAIPLLREALSLAPHVAKLHQLSCFAQFKMGQPDWAEVHGVIAVALDPQAADVVSAVLARDIRLTASQASALLRTHSVEMPVNLGDYGAARDRLQALVRQASGPLHVGSSDFRVWRDRGYAYIDKSSFISSVLTSDAQVMLFSAPRRFGKSLNLSMLRCFLDENDPRPQLFEDLVVWGDDVARQQFARKSVIHFSLKDPGDGRAGLERKLSNLLQEHADRIAGQIDPKLLSSFELKLFDQYRTRSADVHDLVDGFKRLTTWLARSGRSVWLLIDEYDAPVQRAANTDDEDAVLSLLRDVLSAALKDNPHVDRAVLTGVLQVGRESMFSGMNNVVVYPMHRTGSAPWFGFDVYDVLRLSRLRSMTHRFDDMKAWYDGYQSGGRDVFNPWSVLNFLALSIKNPGAPPQAFWGGSGTPTFAQSLIELHEPHIAEDLRRLLGGAEIRAEIDDGVSLPELRTNPKAIWSLLLHSGYLTVDRLSPGTVRTPSTETLYELRKMVRPVLENRGAGLVRFQAFVGALVSGHVSDVEKIVQDVLLVSVSSHDVGRNHENPYHTLILGMLAFLNGPDYEVRSNTEQGHGRPDIVVLPRRGGAGVILELKRAVSESDIESKLAEATAQIRERRYDATFLPEIHVHAYAVAAFGKTAQVRLVPLNRAS